MNTVSDVIDDAMVYVAAHKERLRYINALQQIVTLLDSPVHNNDCRNGAACDIL